MKRSSKIKLLLALGLAALLSPLQMYAAEGMGMVVELKGGKSEKFLLDEKPVVSFSGDACRFAVGSYDVSYDMADIEKAYFATVSTSAETIDVESVAIDLNDPDCITVSGLAPGTVVSVYDLEGRCVATSAAAADGISVTDIRALRQHGVYVVTISNLKSFKLYKR